MQLSDRECHWLRQIWHHFHPREPLLAPTQDERLKGVTFFRDFFRSSAGAKYVSACHMGDFEERYVEVHLPSLEMEVGLADFCTTIRTKPKEVIGAIGMGLSLASMPAFAPSVDDEEPFLVMPRFSGLQPETPLGDIRSHIVGQLVCLRGSVIKVAPYRCLIVSAAYKCSKCGQLTWVHLDDGILEEPTSCSRKGCRARGATLELQRNAVTTSDYQLVKVQELDAHMSDEAARVPKTFEVEVRGSLIDRCITGDTLCVVGIVKARVTSAPRWGGGGKKNETGLHSLYVVANSLSAIKASDRGTSTTATAIGACVEIGGVESTAAQSTPNAGAALASHTFAAERGRGPMWSNAELRMVRSVAAAPACVGLLVQSLCPGIYGNELVKAGLLLALFGGTPTEAAEIGVRADIHVLVVGDPGLGKSQMLKAAAAAAPRSVFVCGITASTAGLTVALSREGKGGDLSIEAGALVLADQGACCIDELDKMSCDPHALLEAMEQQQISVAKAGVVTKMSARTSVLAAANPKDGHYNRGKSVGENIKTNAALLSRFDLVFILVDKPDEQHDKMISEHILAAHRNVKGHLVGSKRVRQSEAFGGGENCAGLANDDKSGGERVDGVTMTQRLRKQCSQHVGAELNVEQLKAYIDYARRYCHPAMTPMAARVLQKLYLTLRSKVTLGDAIPITTRHLESLIRLAQARARMEMRTEVTEADALEVVDLLHESLLDAFTSETGRVDLGHKLTSKTKQIKAIVAQLHKEAQARGGRDALFSRDDIRRVMVGLHIDTTNADELITTMNEGLCYLLRKGPRMFALA